MCVKLSTKISHNENDSEATYAHTHAVTIMNLLISNFFFHRFKKGDKQYTGFEMYF